MADVIVLERSTIDQRRRALSRNPRRWRIDDWAFVALLALVATIPWQGVATFEGVGTLTRSVGLVAGAIGALGLARSGGPRRLHDAHTFAIAFCCWGVASLWWSLEPAVSVTRLVTLAQLVVLLVLVWQYAAGRARHRGLLWAYVIGVGIACGIVLGEHLGGAAVAARYSPAGTHPNSLAFNISLVLPVAWYLSLVERRVWLRLALRAMIPVALLVLVLTASRSAIFTAAIGLTLIPWTVRHVRPAVRILLVIAVIGLVAGAARLLPTAPVERLAGTVTELESGDLNNRANLWAAAWRAIGERPLLGTGIGASRVAIERITGDDQGAHNTYLSVATELGVPGLVLFLLMVVAVARTALRRAHLDRAFAVVFLATLLVGLLPRHWEYQETTWLALALLLGLGAALDDGDQAPAA